MKILRIGLLGLGQIGSAVYQALSHKKSFFKNDLGVVYEIAGIAVKNPRKKRQLKVPRHLLASSAQALLKDPSIDIIVELIGGVKEARKYVLEALSQGKHVVTANKALLAEYGDEIFRAANRYNRWILFEASVGGGIPVMKALREGLVANRIDSVHAIINGTSNYILTQMSHQHSEFKQALKEAQDKGYAEADPTFDVEGVDAAHKLAILARFAFGGSVAFKDIYCEGISQIRSEDISFAEEFGYCIKLLAIAKLTSDGVEARVQPTLLPKSHILASVNGSFNAVLLRGDQTGEVLLYGRGAGPKPTASAVLSDLTDIAIREDFRLNAGEQKMRAIAKKLKVKNISSILSRYYLRFHVVDKPGVLAGIAKILGHHSISISDVIQKERSHGNVVPLILLTHGTHEQQIRQSVKEIQRLAMLKGKAQIIRIEGSAGA